MREAKRNKTIRTLACLCAAGLLLLGSGLQAADIVRLVDGGSLRLRIIDTGAMEVTSSDGAHPGLRVVQSGANKAFVVHDGGTEVFTVADGGNVGIGTPTPGQRLEVNGNIKLSGGSPTYRLRNLAAPVSGSDAATKAYVDAAGGGGSAYQHRQDGASKSDTGYSDVVNQTGPGILYSIHRTGGPGVYHITIDGVQTAPTDLPLNGNTYLSVHGRPISSPAINIEFKTSLRIRHWAWNSGQTINTTVNWGK